MYLTNLKKKQKKTDNYNIRMNKKIEIDIIFFLLLLFFFYLLTYTRGRNYKFF